MDYGFKVHVGIDQENEQITIDFYQKEGSEYVMLKPKDVGTELIRIPIGQGIKREEHSFSIRPLLGQSVWDLAEKIETAFHLWTKRNPENEIQRAIAKPQEIEILQDHIKDLRFVIEKLLENKYSTS